MTMRQTFLLICFATLIPLALEPNGYYIRILTLALLFAALGQAWNIVGGLAGQMSLGHAAFFGLGAYTSTLLLIHFGISPWIGMLAGGVLGGIAAFLLSLPTMRLKGHYFALGTLAFAEVFRVIANTWSSLTGGPVGLSVPFSEPSLAMLQFNETRSYYYLMLAAFVAVSMIFVIIVQGRLGYRLRAVKEGPDAAEVIGVNTTRVKIHAAVISGSLTAMLGTLYAQLNFFFDPDTVFGALQISIRIALIVIVGGIGTLFGPLLGALLIIPLEEFANVMLADRAAGLSQLTYGALLMAIVLLQPQGLAEFAKKLAARISGKVMSSKTEART
ncbi:MULTISPECIES: branched-chain amino acid ABC transporter permease [Aminobacter]|uniref:Branched-chain amino acid transport system permease protein n=1 Tax=Aminobacter ciceronei TaxID=150723 RepID=A0ABR6CCE0_9HYPH|nr:MULTISPECIES: branched-chain amino acid ABC transporter permease [Aminobacter]MBA8908320.1 branched-chain amino acid transport system permease protein [Aminobacter ciceronei]MBA9022092.1 branched-chain amino acid transport system permease protein [Aminobacter ciceronei]MRX34634.1 branched-chain amino acid ABC transporter permease [Aminobacter sp. MDW-2]QNH34774.1 branched-chain amino acid ABC transporter permease [Aminobacter sp. MDW-2]